MNRASIAKRINTAAEQSKRGYKAPVMRCWLSDGTVEDMHILEAINYNRGKLVDNDVVYQEPHIVKAKCIPGEDIAPKLISVCLQMIGGTDEE